MNSFVGYSSLLLKTFVTKRRACTTYISSS